MKYSDFMDTQVFQANATTQAKIGRQLARSIATDFHPADWDGAAKKAVDNFTRQLSQEIMSELNRLKMKQV